MFVYHKLLIIIANKLNFLIFETTANVSCSVVVPKITPQVKCDAVEGYGAELTLCEKPTDRKDVCDKVLSSSSHTITIFCPKNYVDG
jgi:hypothetical protein